ncbi:hypothetical protein COLO4_34124 [Corchorus olitorius]|uniref:Uncharacterized protein n=1 Tax=Corchorus olitorius TaxID=93759 RepID=A0A1R3GNK8_9ROSI|nr:hypothetical protein COLO4_34124 [Corchorus olitorius]
MAIGDGTVARDRASPQEDKAWAGGAREGDEGLTHHYVPMPMARLG